MSGSTYFDIFRFAELPRIFCLIRDNRNSIFNSQFDNRNYDAASHCTIDTVVSSIFLCVVCDLFPEYIFLFIIFLIFIICNIQSIHIYYYNSINIFIIIIDNFSKVNYLLFFIHYLMVIALASSYYNVHIITF